MKKMTKDIMDRLTDEAIALEKLYPDGSLPRLLREAVDEIGLLWMMIYAVEEVIDDYRDSDENFDCIVTHPLAKRVSDAMSNADKAVA